MPSLTNGKTAFLLTSVGTLVSSFCPSTNYNHVSLRSQDRVNGPMHILSMATATPDGDWEGPFNSDDGAKANQFGARRPINLEATSSSSFTPAEEEILPAGSSQERLERMKREKETRSRFLHGDELIELRQYIENLETDMVDARERNDVGRLSDLQKALHESWNMDPEYAYNNCLENAETSEKCGMHDEAQEWLQEANEARACLPQFNLQGLWVGKYGDHGYEMINVTYAGDTLVATKVTGDKNVPKGELTFTADLSPNAEGRDELEPIELSEVASQQWGHKHLPRFPGQGQVAAEGFVNNQWMEGQLILVGEYFSFAWVPIGHQIFYGRPSAELTLKMLKQSKMADFGAVDKGSPNLYAEMRACAERCLEETEMLMDDDLDLEGELVFSNDDGNYFCQEGCFE